MEQAVNTFTKGLLSDTHPMVQGNDTLSDALNATFITMNGNEVVLLNDMGNRRVDNAFLPAGYEPVGIKEYGGIIYVAAYNPITNRSQIGSFPSPERKGKGDSEPLTINFSDLFIDNNTKKLKTKEIIIQITKNSLRAGDKFSIYKIDDNILLSITNLFKLNVGILNSLNEFLDITNDLLKFNDSFIEIRNSDDDLPINDENFMLNRLALPINTYSYKLVSPLYLRVKINTFNTVVWNIEGDKDINENITLYPTATYIFEDGFNIPDDYKFLASIKIGNGSSIDLAEESKLIDSNTVIVTYKSIEFIKEESNYKYNNEPFAFENNIIEYNIYSYLFHNGFYDDNEEIIVDETSGSKDISKLNSDTIEFNGWRYYNRDNGITEGTVDINIYAKHNNSKLESFGAKFKLNNDETTINITLINFSDKTNRFEFNRNDNFTPKTLYNVEFYYKRDGVEITLNNQSSLFITTALFNKSYLGTEDFVYDLKYLTLEGNNNLLNGSKIQDLSIITRINYSYHQHQNVYIQDFCKIKQILIYPIVLWDYSNSQTITTSSENDIFNDTDSHVTYNDEVINTTEIRPHFLVENSELYPYININNEYGTINKNFDSQIKTYDGKTLDEINDSLVNYTGSNSNLASDTITEDSKIINTDYRRINIIQTYKIKNIAKGPSVNRTITLNNVMTSFYDFASRNSLIGTTKPYFCIDNEGGKYYDISVVSDEDSTYGEHNAKKLIGNMENGNKYHYSTNSLLISDYIISHGNSNSLFASELNTDDIVMADSESFPVLITDNSLGGIRTLVHYRRVWIRINSETFIPFIVSGIENDKDTLDFNNVHTLLNNECKKIPHIYVYKLGNESFNTKVLDVNQSYKTKEFNISVKNKFKYNISIENINIINGESNYNISKSDFDNSLLGIDTDSYSEKEDEYQEYNLISNLNFQDFIELLSTYHFDTGYKYGDNYNKYILFDNEGKLLDSKYVYKEIEEGVIQKVYIPSTKFTISNDMYLPNLTYDGTLTNNESGRTYGYIVSTTVIGSDGKPTQKSAVYNYVTTKEDAIVMVQREENQHISLVFDKIPDIYHIGDL